MTIPSFKNEIHGHKNLRSSLKSIQKDSESENSHLRLFNEVGLQGMSSPCKPQRISNRYPFMSMIQISKQSSTKNVTYSSNIVYHKKKCLSTSLVNFL